jgi:hypothetical protein
LYPILISAAAAEFKLLAGAGRVVEVEALQVLAAVAARHRHRADGLQEGQHHLVLGTFAGGLAILQKTFFFLVSYPLFRSSYSALHFFQLFSLCSPDC